MVEKKETKKSEAEKDKVQPEDGNEDGDEFEIDDNATKEVADEAEEGNKQAVEFTEVKDDEKVKNEDEKMETDENTYDQERDSAQR